jgi:hypothetical protein
MIMSERDAEETGLSAQEALAGEQVHLPGPHLGQVISLPAYATPVASVRLPCGKR